MMVYDSWLDLARASAEKLQALADACDPATFGLDQRDVLDESYRKAGKMDSANFSMKLNIKKLRIIDYVHEQLLDGTNEGKRIRYELYKMNVYGKGSFFKSHKDTPRGGTMFASLVVVFPTPHEGGALILRHGGREWTFDSAVLTRNQAAPCIEYIAFYSDVDHEVSPVTSGYRVTVTYNLFLEGEDAHSLPLPVTPVTPDATVFHNALSAALADAQFLPRGGCLAFGLSFQYPVDPQERAVLKTTVLKGSDAMIQRVCTQLSLASTLSAVYYVGDGVQMLVSAPRNLMGNVYLGEDDDGLPSYLMGAYRAKVIHEFGKKTLRIAWEDNQRFPAEDTVRIAWVTPLTFHSRFGLPYHEYYGNEPSSECLYGDLCLAVHVGPPGKRETARTQKTKTRDDGDSDREASDDSDEGTDEDEEDRSGDNSDERSDEDEEDRSSADTNFIITQQVVLEFSESDSE
ncbi:hypothetical protein H0H81_004979 [Sphagnurus paluster]|uniref:Prolyl 4-hydroxylase alpha subunit Fe(2+) 2OG dioxygenase domain-containing protein n=1 Tax=Sphagnurus paluster TaxID=117069 RepID=A0A9P7K572_9AGAR|nr:hypothetical protein H0H81_004979 [Sphagnurus paluster]